MALAVAEETALGQGLDAASVQNSKIPDTPRTREACRRLGFVLEDLHFRPEAAFARPGEAAMKQKMRYKHFEDNRRNNLREVLAERAKVIAQNAKKGEVPGVQSAQFLSMLENLFEKEAKRLETDLKNQLRSHSCLVKENEHQLRMEEDALRKDQAREARANEATRGKKELGEKTKEKLNSRLDANKGRNAIIEAEHQQKQENFAKAVIAEEDRLTRWMEEKGQLNAEKSAHWKARVEGMKEKNAQAAINKRLEGEAKLQEIDTKIAAVTARREDEQMRIQEKSCQQHLELMDVRQRKERIDRVDNYRRGELKEQVDANVERIETLLALKEQLLEQRKARTSKAEATRGSRGLNLRRDCLPGPGQYEVQKSSMMENPTIKIALSNAPDFIEQTIRVTKQNPAPGAYDAKVLPSGDKVSQSAPEGMGKMGNNKRTSFLDDAMQAKEFVPAPGRYELKSQLDVRATKFRRDAIEDEGMDKHDPKQYPVWARPATKTPGPTGYSVDDYTRKETLRRAQRSLPNLTKDMLRPNIPGQKA